MTDLNRLMIAAHRGNIARYGRILRTYLTEFEREFVEHRLSQEQAALQALLAQRRPRAKPLATLPPATTPRRPISLAE